MVVSETLKNNTNKPAANSTKIIDVDRDYQGDLEQAIAAAKDGDTIQLGANTYYTDGLVINHDITIRGRQGSIVNGQATSKSIFHLTLEATGTTIQNLEITNGNNGILVEGTTDVLLNNLDINNIGIEETIRDGSNNTGIILDHADGFQLLNSTIHNIGRKAVGISNTDSGLVSNLAVHDVNLAAEHAQSHDAAGVKLFNTNEITIQDSYFTDINAISIWNDITNLTTIENNQIINAGEDFLAPAFNTSVEIIGIYNEKSSNSTVRENQVNAVGEFTAFRATEFSTETMTIEDNDFSNYQLGTTDYWVNESAEKLVATTSNPDEADFSLFADDYLTQANIGE